MLGASTLVQIGIVFLNQPLVKEAIKNVTSCVTFFFGCAQGVEIYEKGGFSPWKSTAGKAIEIMAKISLLLSAAVSRPGVFLASLFLECLFTKDQWEGVFGPNAIFAINPWHPRHMLSVAALLLALPAAVQAMVSESTWIKDRKLNIMTFFNVLTSRITMHKLNQLFKIV
ncbi:MAG TPA: hypothetical protein VGJ00_10025 [Rhabdochlamydiaceae bacterium]|jgi:hypothetical protein